MSFNEVPDYIKPASLSCQVQASHPIFCLEIETNKTENNRADSRLNQCDVLPSLSDIYLVATKPYHFIHFSSTFTLQPRTAPTLTRNWTMSRNPFSEQLISGVRRLSSKTLGTAPAYNKRVSILHLFLFKMSRLINLLHFKKPLHLDSHSTRFSSP